MDVTNNSKALQGIHTLDGLVYVPPGETKSVRLNETLHGHAKALDFFKLEGEPEKDDLGKADQPAGQAASIEALNAEIDNLKKQLAERDAELAKLKADEPDRDDLKKQADELGIEYPSNVKTAKLKELIDAKLAE